MYLASIRNDDNERFFNEQANNYSGNYHLIDPIILKFLKKQPKKREKFLDVGGGDSSFASLIKDTFPNLDVSVVDPSKRLLEKNKDYRIEKLHGSLPNKLDLNCEFDYISCLYVLHHIAGSSVSDSKELLKNSLITIKNLLNDDGYLIICEIFYEGFGLETLPRNLIFYILLLQNTLNIKIPSKEFLKGLNVCFYTRSELNSILTNCGFEIIEYNDHFWKSGLKKKLLMLKDFGYSVIILKKIKQNGHYEDCIH